MKPEVKIKAATTRVVITRADGTVEIIKGAAKDESTTSKDKA